MEGKRFCGVKYLAVHRTTASDGNGEMHAKTTRLRKIGPKKGRVAYARPERRSNAHCLFLFALVEAPTP